MLDFNHLPGQYGSADVQFFLGNCQAGGESWQAWQKPRGKTMLHILLVGRGGNGGTGVIGANSTAAGGGGGGAGVQVSMMIPMWAIPDTLYLSLAGTNPSTAALQSYLSTKPKLTAGAGTPVANERLIAVPNGANGGNASGATAGAAGAGGVAMANVSACAGFSWVDGNIGGQAGVIGGVAVSAANLTLPVTGVFCTGGTGGGGLPAAATVGTAGGAFNVVGSFPPHGAAVGATSATTPPADGVAGYAPVPGLLYFYGGTGGGSTHGSATGAGLVQSSGGDGAPGCGGGGMGGALTGSTAGRIGLGGPAFAIFTCW